MNEPDVAPALDAARRRLIFRAWHRGTREMDLILGPFAETVVPGLAEAELALLADLLERPDPELYDLVSGRVPPPADPDPVLARLLGFAVAPALRARGVLPADDQG